MRIIVDADAMPSLKKIEDVAASNNIECYFISDDCHRLTSEYSTIITVSKGIDSADMCIANLSLKGDLVITQDYGVASIGLLRKSYVIDSKGFEYNNDNIDNLVNIRHINKKNKNLKGPKKRTLEDDINLKNKIEKLIEISKNC